MEGQGFEDHTFNDYAGQPLPSLNSTLLKNQQPPQDNNLNVHSIQVMLGLQQGHELFANMGTMGGQMDYKGSPQKLDSPGMHQELGMFNLENNNTPQVGSTNGGGVKRKNEEMMQNQQNLSSNEIGTTTSNKKNDKKKGDNNGVKKKKTR